MTLNDLELQNAYAINSNQNLLRYGRNVRLRLVPLTYIAPMVGSDM